MLKTAAAVARLGTESAFEVLARAKQLEAAGRDIVNLGIGLPEFQTHAHVVVAAVQALPGGHHGDPAARTPVAGKGGAVEGDVRCSLVTGVQTGALPISSLQPNFRTRGPSGGRKC